MKHYYINQNCSTNDLFSKIKILTLEQLYDKLSTIMNTKIHIIHEERIVSNLRLVKPNTTLMVNYYINRGIQLFNHLSRY